jgi:hypothetical protein
VGPVGIARPHVQGKAIKDPLKLHLNCTQMVVPALLERPYQTNGIRSL